MSILNKAVLIVAKSNSQGGAEKNAYWLFNKYLNEGHDVKFLCLEFHDNVRKNHIYCSNKNYRKSLIYILKTLYILKPKTVIVFTEYMFPIFAITKMIFGFRLIFRSINTPRESNTNSLLFKINKKLLPLADIIVFQSKCMAKSYSSFLNLNRFKYRIVYNPMKSKPNSNIKIKFRKELKIVSIGRIEDQKNYFETFKVLEELKRCNNSFHLDIFGQGSLIKELESIALRTNLINFVSFKGYDENVVSKIKNYDALMLTSKYEGFPNVLLEAISQGVPVVSYDIKCGPSEIIINGLNGFLIPNENRKEMVNALLSIKNHDWNKKQMVESLNRFNEQTIYEEYKSII